MQNLEDEEEVNQHLYKISKEIGGLVCVKCGCRRKYVKSFVRHVQTCDENYVSINVFMTENELHRLTDDIILVVDAVQSYEKSSKMTCCRYYVMNVEEARHA